MEEILETMRGPEIFVESILQKGFSKPILINERSGLDIVIPEYGTFDYDSVVGILGKLYTSLECTLSF